ncbi:MAG TPA: ABC transporter ATP-binding protein [Verrucomicrobiae bacterium]|jgi:ABC-2 type transport system ATP-binding protein|nr:ABC transporter ATP-binding protein [Verrucomicrobiae bacterium]
MIAITERPQAIAPLPKTSPAEFVVARLESVNKNYGPVQALRGVHFEVRKGEVVALVGPNGAGKTTAVKLFLGLMPPNSGKVRVFGADPTNPENRLRTGAMLQVGRVPETLRVREHIDLFSSYYQKRLSLSQVLAAAGLEKLSERKFSDLSGGQKQRVLFALAICGDPDLIFLDEPTVGLDVEARRLLWDEIRRMVARGKTILLTTHYLQEADALADRIAVINQGAIIAQGTPAEIKAQTSGKKIRCVTRLGIPELRRITGVREVKEDREAVEIHTAEAEPVLRELFALDANVSGLEVIGAGLEDAFLALTSESKDANNRSGLN